MIFFGIGFKNLRILDFVDDTGRCEVENAGTAVDGGGNSFVIQWIHLEQMEARGCTFESFQMFRLFLILYSTIKISGG